MKYKILVIDDEHERRKPFYEAVLGDVATLEYLSGPEEIHLLGNRNVHGYIVDMVLDWSHSGLADEQNKKIFDLVIEAIGGRGPIILVSSQWQDVAAWLNDIAIRGVTIAHYFSWSEFEISRGEISKNDPKLLPNRLKILEEIRKYHQHTPRYKEEGEKVVLLHISDPQFGDPEHDGVTFLSDQIISGYLIRQEITPDLLVVTGDLAYSGKPSEFDLAQAWLLQLAEGIFDFEGFQERILIVPGNHDVNLALSAVDNYSYKFDHNGSNFLNLLDFPLNEHRKYGLYPFREFAFQTTGDPRWMDHTNDLCWVNDRFLSWGIRIFQLNSVSNLDYLQPSHVEISKDSIARLGKVPDAGSDIFYIHLVHHSPEDFGYKTGLDSRPPWINFSAFFERLNRNNSLVLHGHRHVNLPKYRLAERGALGKIDFLMAATTSLSPKSRKSDSLRGFNIIELQRKEGRIVDSQVRSFEFRGSAIKEYVE